MLQSKAGLNKSFFAMEFKREGQGGFKPDEVGIGTENEMFESA